MQNKQNRWQLSWKVYSCWTNINMCLVNNISTVRNSVDQSESKAQPCTSTPEKSVVYNVSWAEFKLQIASIGTSHLYTTHLGMLLLRNKKLHQNCGYHETQESTERSEMQTASSSNAAIPSCSSWSTLRKREQTSPLDCTNAPHRVHTVQL